MSPRKSRKKAPATEPKPVAEILDQSPIAQILASRDARAEIEPDQPMPEQEAVAAFQRQREHEQAVSHVEQLGPAKPSTEAIVTEALVVSQRPKSGHVERLTGLRPTPSGFVGLESFKNAGIRLSRSLDKNVVAIQFADDQKPSRDGLSPENERLRDRGFLYVPMRSQWERVDRQRPAENYQDAKAFVALLVNERLAAAGADVGRS